MAKISKKKFDEMKKECFDEGSQNCEVDEQLSSDAINFVESYYSDELTGTQREKLVEEYRKGFFSG